MNIKSKFQLLNMLDSFSILYLGSYLKSLFQFLYLGKSTIFKAIIFFNQRMYSIFLQNKVISPWTRALCFSQTMVIGIKCSHLRETCSPNYSWFLIWGIFGYTQKSLIALLQRMTLLLIEFLEWCMCRPDRKTMPLHSSWAWEWGSLDCQ